jgi:lipoate-protein ligase A
MIPWRLIDTGLSNGRRNMAVDQALLSCFNPDCSRPVLRLYGWVPPAISLGRFQVPGEVLDLARCAAAGVPVVRRITGGGAIYHTEELTYALVCASHHLPGAASVKESYRLLTRFLLRFYALLGLDACYAMDLFPAGTRLGERTPFCFAGKEQYDIMIDGRKVGGNAQRRLKGVIFQHGSIPLANRAAFGATFLREPPAGVDEIAASLQDFGVRHPRGVLTRLMVEAFMETLPAIGLETSLTAEEETVATLLAGDRQELTV